MPDRVAYAVRMCVEETVVNLIDHTPAPGDAPDITVDLTWRDGVMVAVIEDRGPPFDPRDLEFRRVRTEDNPGQRDMVQGIFDIHRRDGRSDAYRFSCSVNFESGRVFNARYEPLKDDRDRR